MELGSVALESWPGLEHDVERGFAGVGFDDQPAALGRQCLADVTRGGDRAAHVVQAVEARDQVVAVTGE
jgi:hypothetical protein